MLAAGRRSTVLPLPLVLVAGSAVALLLALAAAPVAKASGECAGCHCQCPVHPPRLTPGPALPESAALLVDKYVGRLEKIRQDLGIPSSHLSVLWGDHVVYEGGLGSALDDGGPPPDASNYFYVGSTTKTLTGALFMHAVSEGRVHTDQQVSELVNDFAPLYGPFPKTARGPTMGQLASHTSGLSRYGNCPNNNCGTYTTSEMVARINQQELIHAPGSTLSYSNIGLSFLGHATAAALGYDDDDHGFERAMEERIFAPLGMEATFNRSAVPEGKMTVGISAAGDRLQPTVRGWENPSGGVLITPGALQRFLRFLNRGSDANADAGADADADASVIDAGLVREWIFNPTHVLATGGQNYDPGNGSPAQGYGMPWEYVRAGGSGYWLRTKDGAGNGWASQIGLIPELQIGVAYVQTRCCSVDLLSKANEEVVELLAELGRDLRQLATAGWPLAVGDRPELVVGDWVLPGVPAEALTVSVTQEQIEEEAAEVLVMRSTVDVLWLWNEPIVLAFDADASTDERRVYQMTDRLFGICRAAQGGVSLNDVIVTKEAATGQLTMTMPRTTDLALERLDSRPERRRQQQRRSAEGREEEVARELAGDEEASVRHWARREAEEAEEAEPTCPGSVDAPPFGLGECACGCDSIPSRGAAAAATLPTAEADAVVADYVSDVEQLMEELDIPAAHFSIIHDQKVLYRHAFGHLNSTDPASPPVDEHSIFELNSVSKVLSAGLLLVGVDRGAVSLDDPVSKFLPAFDPAYGRFRKTARGITVGQVASHMAGFGRYGECGGEINCNPFTTDEVLDFMASTAWLILPPGTRGSYSNIGYSLAGHVAAVALGYGVDEFEDALKIELLRPLGMEFETGFDLSHDFKAGAGARVVVGKDASGAQVPPTTEGGPDTPRAQRWQNPSGGALSTAVGMERFVSFLFRDEVSSRLPDGSRNPAHVIDGALLRSWLFEQRFLFPDAGTPDALPLKGPPPHGYGIGWEWQRRDGVSLWTRFKAGAGAGFQAQVAVVPELKLGMVWTQAACCSLDLLSRGGGAQMVALNKLAALLNKAALSQWPLAPGPDGASLVGEYEAEGGWLTVTVAQGGYDEVGADVLVLTASNPLIFLNGAPLALNHEPTDAQPLRYALTERLANDCRAGMGGIVNTHAIFSREAPGSGPADTLLLPKAIDSNTPLRRKASNDDDWRKALAAHNRAMEAWRAQQAACQG